MKTFAIVIIALALAAPGSSQEKATPAPLPSVALPPELDRVLRDYEKAWRAKDAEALANLFAEDGFVLANGALPVRGRPAIRQAYSGAVLERGPSGRWLITSDMDNPNQRRSQTSPAPTGTTPPR